MGPKSFAHAQLLMLWGETMWETPFGQYCTLTFSMRRISSQQRSLEIHFARWVVLLPQSIAKVFTSESYSNKSSKCYSESVYKGFRGDDSVPLTIHTTRWHVNDVCLYKPTSRQCERARDRDLGWKHADVCLEKQKSTGCPRFWGSCH